MARNTGAVCRLCRREDAKLFLKGERCYTDKCAYERRQYPPGKHGQRRRGRMSDYGLQLREKQKVKRMYGLMEGQFRLYYHKADQLKGVTGTQLLVMLERRLDNTVYRLGFAASRNQSRQMIRHGHFSVNGRRVNIPSFQVKMGDVIEVREKSRQAAAILHSLETVERQGVPQWLDLAKDEFKGTVQAMPTREDITMPIQEQLVVELYSK